jgi:hypothetical protein
MEVCTVRFQGSETGLGVKATRKIEPGSWLSELSGFISNEKTFVECYSTFAYDREKEEEGWRTLGGPLRLLNHCCAPNAEVCLHRFIYPAN